MSSIRVQILPSKAAVVTFDVPGEKLNVLSTALMTEFEAVLTSLSADISAGNVTGVVFISGKEDSFFAGANLDEIVPIQYQPSAVSFDAAQQGKAVFGKIAALPVPTVAAVNGICLGGGTELALACKYRLASDSPKTKLGLPEVGLGFLPGWGGTVRLTKLVGLQAAQELILNPLKSWESKKAWYTGMVDEVVPTANLLERALEVALGAKPKRARQSFIGKTTRKLLDGTGLGRMVFGMMARKGIMAETKGQLPAPFEALKVMLAALTMPAEKAFELESKAFSVLAVTPESRNLVGFQRALTATKKSPEGVKPLPVKTIGVLGAGVMGSGIAQLALYQGYDVVLYDLFPAGLEKGVKNIKDLFLDRAKVKVNRRMPARILGSLAALVLGFVFCGWLGLLGAAALAYGAHRLINARLASEVKRQKAANANELDERLAKQLKTTGTYEDLKDCDLIIEAIVEDLAKKKEAIALIEKVKAAKALADGKPSRWIFATNTSSLSVTEMAEDAQNPADVGALHFFNPPGQMKVVEVPRGAQTSAEAVATIKSIAAKLGKVAVETADETGFAVNRDLAPYCAETIKLMEAGVPLSDIEEAMKRFGMRMGPLAMMDEVGLDVCAKVIEVMEHRFGPRLKAPAILGWIKEKKLFGKKGGLGIYVWEDGKRKGFNPELLAVLPEQKNKKSFGEIQDRLVLAMVNEAARALGEGVVESAGHFDVAMILGTGFPPQKGGPLRYADQVGLRAVMQKLEWLQKVAGDNYEPAPLLVQKASKGETFYA